MLLLVLLFVVAVQGKAPVHQIAAMVAPHIFISGKPGVGKTTLIQNVCSYLKATRPIKKIQIVGFYTREIRSEVTNRRVGFEAVGVSTGERALLAHVKSPKHQHRVGRYGVKLNNFESLLERELLEPVYLRDHAPAPHLRIIDEIGKMECFSEKFVETMNQLLNEDIPILGTVALEGSGLIEQVKTHNKVGCLYTVTESNRDDLVKTIAEQISANMESCE